MREEIVMSEAPRFLPTRQLPRHPNLEQVRKQAKDLLDRYRGGDPAAVAEVERFERRPHPQSFALHDAQRVLARAYGYDSWSKLKAFFNGANVEELAAAVQAGDITRAQALLRARPELATKDMGESNEHRALHYAVLRRDPAMVRLLMEAGADARKGIYPHRDATSPLAIAREREYGDISAVIEQVERQRREAMSCPNATISPAQDRIAAAIREGQNETAIALLEADRSLILACDREGATALHLAAEEANQPMIEWLLAHGANVHKQDRNGRTPLARAALAADPRNDAAQSFPETARRLAERGAEVTIHAAVALGDAARVRELVEADTSLLRRIAHNGGLLTLAVNYGQIEIVRLLLDLGADVDERIVLEELEEPTPSWGMPLWNAALANRFEVAELLLDRGADPNANVYASGWPLRNAWGHKDGLLKKLLLGRGARPQPYMIAEAHDVTEAARLLASDPGEDMARELAWSSADHGCPAILELALPRLAWPLDDAKWHWVIIQPIRGATADRAGTEGHFACMATLLKHGVDPNVARYGQTALHFAAAYGGSVSDVGRARFAGMLLDSGARLDLRDDLLKSTPLGWACRWGRIEMVETLISRGAPVDEPDAESWATPKAWARKMGRDAILVALSASIS
jgi:ankyrin repeat protein